MIRAMPTLQFLRSFRFGEYAYFDLIVSFIGICLLGPLLSKLFLKLKLKVSQKSWIYFTLPIGIIIHLLVRNSTPMTRDFIDLHGHYILKAVIVGLLLLGLKDIKRIKKL